MSFLSDKSGRQIHSEKYSLNQGSKLASQTREMRVVFRSCDSKKYPLANICEYRYFSSRISIKKITLLENFVAKNYENIQNYEKECRFQVSHWSAVLCRTYAQFSCACVFYGRSTWVITEIDICEVFSFCLKKCLK